MLKKMSLSLSLFTLLGCQSQSIPPQNTESPIPKATPFFVPTPEPTPNQNLRGKIYANTLDREGSYYNPGPPPTSAPSPENKVTVPAIANAKITYGSSQITSNSTGSFTLKKPSPDPNTLDIEHPDYWPLKAYIDPKSEVLDIWLSPLNDMEKKAQKIQLKSHYVVVDKDPSTFLSAYPPGVSDVQKIYSQLMTSQRQLDAFMQKFASTTIRSYFDTEAQSPPPIMEKLKDNLKAHLDKGENILLLSDGSYFDTNTLINGFFESNDAYIFSTHVSTFAMVQPSPTPTPAADRFAYVFNFYVLPQKQKKVIFNLKPFASEKRLEFELSP